MRCPNYVLLCKHAKLKTAMKALLQRVSQAQVTVNNEIVGAIDAGLLVLVCAEPNDTTTTADKLLAKILKLRLFSDSAKKMNLSLQDIQGGLLLVSQFTLAADCSKGTRPGFTQAAPPELAQKLFDYLLTQAQQQHHTVQSGVFGADMQVALTNDGPVTIWLEVA